MGDSPRSETVSTKLERIAQQARDYPEMVFTTLAHNMDVDFLREAFRQINKSSAPGVDGMTAQQYAANLDENLQDLHQRMKDGTFRATPVQREWLDKESGKKRPIGKLVVEDKIVQRAMGMILEAIYEEDFYDFSYGFRPERSAHDALRELRQRCMTMNINWIVDADVSGFFDNLEHGVIRDILKLRVNDGGLIRLLGKFLNAGVLEGETLSYPDKGTPQGGVISPMLGNIVLHHVLDEWFVEQVQPRLKGQSFLIRFADDFVIGCEYESDARRIMDVLPQRFGRYGLTIHPEKTTLVEFGKPRRGDHKRGTFDFLGFTHYWAKSRRGYWVIKRKTRKKRLKRSLKAIWEWCKLNRHRPLKDQYREFSAKLTLPRFCG